MAIDAIRPEVSDPEKGKFYKNRDGEWFAFVGMTDGGKKKKWERCCWYVLGRKQFGPDYKCPACKTINLPHLDESEISGLLKKAA